MKPSFLPSISRPIETGGSICCDIERNGIRRIMRVAAVLAPSFCLVSLSPRSHPWPHLAGRLWIVCGQGQDFRCLNEVPPEARTYDYSIGQPVAFIAGQFHRLSIPA